MSQIDDIIKELKGEVAKAGESKKDLLARMKEWGLTESEARELAGLKFSSAWSPLMRFFRFIQTENDNILRSATSVDVIRQVQGRTHQLNEIAGLLHTDLPSCFNAPVASKGGA